MTEPINKEAYLEWKHLPETKLFHQFLKDKRQALMEEWAEGQFQQQTMEQSAVLNSAAMAQAQCLLDLVELADDYISDFYRQKTKGSEDVRAD